MTVRIEDPADPRAHDYTGLTDMALRRRREPAEGLYIAESVAVIRRALAAGHRPRSLLMATKWLGALSDVLTHPAVRGVPVMVADEQVLREITGFHVHRGALAAMRRPDLPTVVQVLRGARRVVVLEDIVDHTNVGAIFRCAAGLGFDAVLVSPSCADPLYRRSVRVSMGAVFMVPWTRLASWPGGLGLLGAAGFTLAALSLDEDAVPLDPFSATPPDRLAWILGTEGDGLSAACVSRADVVVRIPMHGAVDSLNVAAAAAIALWATRGDREVEA